MTRIAVIEDSDQVRSLIQDVLTSRGYEVEAHADCTSGVEALGRNLPDLLLTDLRLPDGSGLDAVSALRQIAGERHVPSIVLSGISCEEEMLEAYSAGASDYLTKPFKPSELLAKICIALRRAMDTNAEAKWREAETAQWGSPPVPGSWIDRRFTLQGKLGEGSYGRVFAAVEHDSGERAALKIAKPNAWDSESPARFLREVYTLKSVESPHVARLLGSGRAGALPYIAMEFVEGPTLRAYVTEHGALSLEETRALLIGLSRAVQAIESVGLVHRDIKPSNVILRDGQVSQPVLIDFGLAKQALERGLTQEGLIQGTPGYVSPEVLEGVPESSLSDQFALGMTVYYAVVGAPPFGGERGMALLRTMSTTPVPIPSGLPRWLRRCLQRLTKIYPDQRYSSAGELLAELVAPAVVA